MTNKQYSEEEYVKMCLRLVEKKLKWDESKLWRHREFVKLSELIYEETKYRMSVTTLKRIWGKVKYKGNISHTSLDALSVFVGYRDWIDFKIAMSEQLREGKDVFFISTIKDKSKLRVSFPNKLFAGIFVVAILAAIIFYGINSNKEEEFNYQNLDYTFNCYNSKGVVPFSVKFSFDVSNVTADSMFIQAGDKNRKHRIRKDDNFMTRMYFVPGKKTAKLHINDRVVDEIDLFAFTQGWLGVVFRTGNDHPVYISQDSIIAGEKIHIEPSQLASRQVNISQPYFINFYYVKHFDLDGDNFSFKVRTKNSTTQGADICEKTNIGILTTDGFMVIPLIGEGCLALAKLFVSEKYINGWTDDLSMFAVEMNKWHEVYLKISNKHVDIYIDNRLMYELSYEEPLGEVIGFRVEFSGTGSLDFAELRDVQQNVVYHEDFGGLSK